MIRNQIYKILEDLLKYDDIHACMIVEKGMQGINPPTEKFDKKVLEIWEIFQKTLDDLFNIIEHYSEYGVGEISLRVMGYEIMVYVIPNSNTALVAVVPSLANKGIVEIALESTRNKVIDIIK